MFDDEEPMVIGGGPGTQNEYTLHIDGFAIHNMVKEKMKIT